MNSKNYFEIITFPLRNLAKYKYKYIFYIIIKILNLFFTIIQPFVLAKIVNSIYLKDSKYTYTYIVILSVCYLLKILTEYLAGLNKTYLNYNVVTDIKSDMIKSILDFKTSVFDEAKIGEFISKFHSDVTAIVEFIVDYVPTLAMEVFKLIVIGIVIGSVDIKLMLCILVGSIIVTFIFIKYGKKSRLEYIKFRKIVDLYFSNMYETMNNIREIKNLGIRDISLKKTIKIFEDVKDGEISYNNILVFSDMLTTIIDSVVIIIVISWSTYLVFRDFMPIDNFIIFFSYSSQFSNSLKETAKFNSKIQANSVSFERVYDMLFDNNKKENIFTNKSDITDITDITDIKINNLSFSYSKNKKILNNISMSFKDNSLVAIVGPSGNGKSTILHILNRLYENYDGEVFINNVNLKNVCEKNLRNSITRVFQEPSMFNMSIIDNLRLVNPKISDDKIIECCKRAYIHEFICSLSEGYDSIIQENSVNISIGQKQRLAIARALVKGSKVLLLDEITSSLDNEAQEYINTTINEIRKNHIIILVSHKISNIKNADKIYVIDKGEIVAEGNHFDLINSNETYRILYELEKE